MENIKTELINYFNDFDFKTLTTNERIYLLYVLYSYYEGTLTAYYGSGLFFLSSGIDDLNDSFKVLRKRMIELIDSDIAFDEIKKGKSYQEVIVQISSLYTSAEFLDVIWEDSLLPSIIDLREQISNKNLFENKSKLHKIKNFIQLFLNNIIEEIEVMKTYLNKETSRFNEKYPLAPIESVNDKSKYYITKEGDDFWYKGRLLELSKTSDYYKVFSALYARRPTGGEIKYDELISEINSRISKTKSVSEVKMRKFIQSNLTDKSNGFIRYAKIPATEDNSRPLIKIIPSIGVNFNNKAG